MAGLTIDSNTVDLQLDQNRSADNIYTPDGDFTINIPVGSKTEMAGNAFYLTMDGDKQLLITDTAGDGYSLINFNEAQNRLASGTYLIGCIYVAGQVTIKVIDNIIIP